MQLRESLSYVFVGSKKRILTNFSFYLLGILALTGFLFLVEFLLGFLGVFGFGGKLPLPIWNLLFFVIIIFEFLSCLNRLTGSLFMAEDNKVLLSYPVKNDVVFSSKIIVLSIYQLVRMSFTLLPLTLSIVIAYSSPWYVYLWTILALIITTFAIVSISALLSIPFFYLKKTVERFPIIKSLSILSLLILATVLIFLLVNAIPENLSITTKWSSVYLPSINSFAYNVGRALTPLTYLSVFITGYAFESDSLTSSYVLFPPSTFYTLLALVLIIGLAASFTAFLVKKFYFAAVSSSHEFRNRGRHIFKAKKNSILSGLQPVFISPADYLTDEYLASLLDRLDRNGLTQSELPKIINTLNSYAGQNAFHITNGLPNNKLGKSVYAFRENENGREMVLLCLENDHPSVYVPRNKNPKNRIKKPFISAIWSDITRQIRSTNYLVENYLLFIVTPVATLLLNSIFEAMKKSFSGQLYTLLFNGLLICLILLSTNVSAASAFSREGRAGYLSLSNPLTLLKSLMFRHAVRGVIMAGSIVFTFVIYNSRCSLNFIPMWAFAGCVFALYFGHLLWSIELDYMNPKISLYRDVGGSASLNTNEAKSSVLALIISVVFTLALFVFVNESTSTGFYHLLAGCLFFLLTRIILFLRKVKTYGLLPFEEGDSI